MYSDFFISKDSVQETDTEWEVILKVKVKQLKQSDKDIYRVQQVSDILCWYRLSDELDPVSGSLAFYFKYVTVAAAIGYCMIMHCSLLRGCFRK